MMTSTFSPKSRFSEKGPGAVKSQRSTSSAYPPLPHSHIFFGETKFVKSSPKENAENYPVDRWNGGVFHQCNAARLNDLISEGLNNG